MWRWHKSHLKEREKEEICIHSLAGILNAAFQFTAETLSGSWAGGPGTSLRIKHGQCRGTLPHQGRFPQPARSNCPHSAQLYLH